MPLSDPDTLPRATRGRFQGLDDAVHLASHSLGAVPRGARQVMLEYADQWARASTTAWDQWFPQMHRTSDQLASLIGAPPGSVVLHQNVSVLFAAFLSALRPTGERRRIVCSGYDFPTLRYILDAHQRLGFELVKVDSTDAEALAAAVDERTLCVTVSHVFHGTSTLLDPAPLVKAARHNGALVLLDAYQSVGTVPVDVSAMDADVLLGGFIKWLCGGPGLAYAYIRPSLADTLHPAMTGWLSHAQPFAFEATLRETEGAWRFLGGTPNPLTTAVAACGLSLIAELDAKDIRAHSLRLTRRLMDGARQLGCEPSTPTDDARRGGTVVVKIADASAVCAALAERRIWVDARPGIGLRVSPHVYTTDAEVDTFLRALHSLTS